MMYSEGKWIRPVKPIDNSNWSINSNIKTFKTSYKTI